MTTISTYSPKYPHVSIQLTGTDGNAFAVISRVANALRKAGVHDIDVKSFVDAAMSGTYDQVLQTCMKWVDVQ